MSSLNVDLFGWGNCRRYTLLVVIVFLTAVCFSVTWEAVWPWLAIVFLFLTLLIVDCMFLGEDNFLYDPDYANWSRKNSVARVN